MMLPYYFSLLLLLAFPYRCRSRRIFVSLQGKDGDGCGERAIQTCRSISFAIQTLRKNENNVTIELSPQTHYINTTIILGVESIHLLSSFGYATIKSTLSPSSHLLTVNRDISDGKFMMGIGNVNFVETPSVLYINSNFLNILHVTIYNVTFENSIGNPIYINLLKPNNGDPSDVIANIGIEKTTIIGSTFDSGRKGLLGAVYVYAKSRVHLTLTVKNSQFIRNSVSGRGVCRGVIVIQTYNRNMAYINILNSNFVNGHGSAVCIYATQLNDIHVTLSNVKISNNTVDDKGTVDIITLLDNRIVMNSSRMTISNNKAKRGTGFFLSFDESNISNITMSNITYRNNTAEHGASILFKAKRRNQVTIDYSNSTHVNNRAEKAGGALAFFAETLNNIVLKFTRLKFLNNSAEHGGALSVFPAQFNNFTIDMEEIVFMNNIAFLNGGAINLFEERDAENRKNIVKTSISDSIFMRNSARLRGGAISMILPIRNEFNTFISRCSFIENNARIGGGIAATSGMIKIENTTFHENKGNRGGTLYLLGGGQRNAICHSFFRSDIGNVIEVSSDIELVNTSFILVDNTTTNNDRKEIQVFIQHDKSLKIVSPFNIRCPLSYNVHKKSSHVIKRRGLEEMIDLKSLSYLTVTCVPCEKGTYSVNYSLYTWNNTASSTGGNAHRITCNPCPSGGHCQPGRLRSLPNYWGYRKSSHVRFIPCPIGYCRKEPITYNSCAMNREGYLCGKCKENHSLNLLSNNCISNNYCDESSVTFVLLFLLVPLVVVIILSFINDLKRMSTMAWNYLKRIELSKICRKMKDAENNVTGENGNDENVSDDGFDGCGDGDKASFFTKMRLIFFFYQLQSFMTVPSVVKSSSTEALQKVLATIFSLNLIDSADNHVDAVRICLFEDFSFLHKKAINLCLWIYPISVTIVLYIIAGIIRIKFYSIAGICTKLKNRLTSCFTQLVLLSYIPIATSLFELVHCVKIYTDNGEVNVLFAEGGIHCYQWWQSGIIVIVSVWIVPFALSLYICSKLLKMGRTTRSFMTMCFPPLSLLSWYTLKNEKKVVQQCYHLELKSVVSRDSDDNNAEFTTSDETGGEKNVESDPLVHKSFFQTNIINSDNTDVKMDADVEIDVKGVSTKKEHSNEILEIMQGPYQLTYWPSLQVLRHILLVGIFVFIDFIALRLYTMGVVLIIHLIVLIFKQPYKDRVMNWLDISLSVMLLILDLIGIFDTLRIYHIPHTEERSMLHSTFRVLKAIILILPIVFLLVYTLIDKLHAPSDQSNEKKEKLKTALH